MKGEEIVNEIVNSPELLQKIVDKVYEKLRNDVIIKRLESIEDEIKKLYEQQSKILEKLGEMSNKIEDYDKKFEEQKQGLSSLQSEMQGVKRDLESINTKLQEHTQKFTDIEGKLQTQGSSIEEVKKSVERLEKEHGKILEEHTQKLTDIEKQLQTQNSSINRLEKIVGTYTSRAGRDFEKTMMELYKEALELHGVDPDKVQHGYIVDEKGVTGHKGLKYEVDFYEVTDGEVYIFEVKTNGDKGAVEQLLDRKLLFESLGKKVTKMFLVCNVIEGEDKKYAEEYGITVIAGTVI